MRTKRVVLIGAGDIDFHYRRVLRIAEDDFDWHLRGIAESLAKAGVEIAFLPDKGVNLEIAKLYRASGGRKKVIELVPDSDKTIGVGHLAQYRSTVVGGRPLFDDTIDTGDWFKHDIIIGLLGDALLYLGAAPGAEGERHYAVYFYKLINRKKKKVTLSKKKLHPGIRAGPNYRIISYTPFLARGDLAVEDRRYMNKLGIRMSYARSPRGLTLVLRNLGR